MQKPIAKIQCLLMVASETLIMIKLSDGKNQKLYDVDLCLVSRGKVFAIVSLKTFKRIT